MDLRGLRVLVVEDDADCLELFTVILRHCGAEVAAASSVREAMELFEHSRPAVVVSDISMPGEDGFGLLRRLRERGTSIPTVAVTAFGKEHSRAQCLGAGFRDHLTKPVDPDVLCKTVAGVAGTA
jgi:CheY-like chemotaxis protein